MQNTNDISPLFSRAITLHQAGNLRDAETLYRMILASDPRNADALRMYGTIYHQCGNHEEAIRLIGLSLQVNPIQPGAFSNLGLALHAMQRYDEALASFDKAIALSPDLSDAYNNRGNALQQMQRNDDALASYDKAIALRRDYAEAHNNRGNVLQKMMRYEEALESYKKSISLNPGHADVYNSLGNVLQKMMKYEEALESFGKAIALKPDYATAYNNRGTALYEMKRFADALESCEKAIALKPDYAIAYNNRGNSLQKMTRYEEALESYEKATMLTPDYAEAHNNQGVTLQKMKRYEGALVSCKKAIALNPDYADSYYNQGLVFQQLKQYEDALASYEKAIILKSDYADAYNNQGVLLQDMKRFDEALASYEKAIALNPDYADAYNNQGIALQKMTRYEEALVSYEKVLSLNPDYPYVLGAILQNKRDLFDWQGVDHIFGMLVKAIEAGKPALYPFLLLATASSMVLQRQCAVIFTNDKYPPNPTPLWNGKKYSHDRIRIGYFSADLHERHPLTSLMAEFFEHHDRSKFEVTAFSFGPSVSDPMRTRLENAFEHFIDVWDKSEQEIAILARSMEIDIAVDLNGHTADSRTGIFAMRPAPVQISYMGYPGTMGASYIDYLVADPIVIPEEHKPYYTEKIVHLPYTYWVTDSTRKIAKKCSTRQDEGLPENGFVFCCFNNSYKISPDVFDIWMRLLHKVEGSVLWTLEGHATATKNLRAEAEKRGIAGDRLIFGKRMDRNKHLARQQLADLFLDTFHYNAHTTTSDALWEGLPVLTYLGEKFTARVAASELQAAGMPELITHSHAEYEALAFELATNPHKLADIRKKLARNRATCPLFNTKLFTRYFEDAYVKMWERSQAGLLPEDIYVES